MSAFEQELEKKYLKAVRLKTIKELENEYSKEIVSLYKQQTEQQNKAKEYDLVIEKYKKLLEEIEYLKGKKEELLLSFQKSEKDANRQKYLLNEYLNQVEKKKNEFDNFMKEKGRDALLFLRRNKEIQEQLKEEIKKLGKKKQVKAEMVERSKTLVDNYKVKKQIEEAELLEQQNDPHVGNIVAKISQTFHNNGNKIDYSTTRFHNVLVLKHGEENLEPFISADVKAERETENLKIRKKSKEKMKNKFLSDTALNAKEIIKKERAEKNLKRLEEELENLNQQRKKSRDMKHTM
jgi:hypothetical protein